MTAQELRLGNWVNTPEGIAKVVAIDHAKVRLHRLTEKGNFAVYDEAIEHIEPITLTKDILFKCGFSDKEYKNGYIGIDVNSGGMTTDFVLTKPLVMGEFQKSYAWEYRAGNIPFFKQIKHLHQLQNLLFSLCGQELEVKYDSNITKIRLTT